MRDSTVTNDDEGGMLPVPAPRGELSAAGYGMAARESGESLALYTMAARFPRNVLQARAAIQNAFARPRLAENACYEYAKGGTEVKGPSIRAAEALAQYWENVGHGYAVANEWQDAQGVKVSEVKVWAVDYQGRNRCEVSFNVRHWRATRGGGYKLTDDREVYELVANMAARRKRACILAVIPGDVVDDAMEQAETTLRAKADTSPEALKKMVDAFAQFGVTGAQIAARIQRNLESISPAQVLSLKRIWLSLRDGMSQPGQWFDTPAADGDGQSVGAPAGGSLAAVRAGLAGATPAAQASASGPPSDEPPQVAPSVRRAARRTAPLAAQPTAEDMQEQRFVVDDMLKRIHAAQTLADLDGKDEWIGEVPDPADRALLTEALMHRQALLGARTPINDEDDHQRQGDNP